MVEDLVSLGKTPIPIRHTTHGLHPGKEHKVVQIQVICRGIIPSIPNAIHPLYHVLDGGILDDGRTWVRINLLAHPADSLLLAWPLNPVFAFDVARHSGDDRSSGQEVKLLGILIGSIGKISCTSFQLITVSRSLPVPLLPLVCSSFTSKSAPIICRLVLPLFHGTPISLSQHVSFVSWYCLCHCLLFIVLLFSRYHAILHLYDFIPDQSFSPTFSLHSFAFVPFCKLVICYLTHHPYGVGKPVPLLHTLPIRWSHWWYMLFLHSGFLPTLVAAHCVHIQGQ